MAGRFLRYQTAWGVGSYRRGKARVPDSHSSWRWDTFEGMLGLPFLLIYLLAVSVGVTMMTPLISRDPLREGFFIFMVGVSLAPGGMAFGRVED